MHHNSLKIEEAMEVIEVAEEEYFAAEGEAQSLATIVANKDIWLGISNYLLEYIAITIRLRTM